MARETSGHRKENHGFTLVEMLVVIGIIGALAGLVMPVLARARESAKRSKCIGNMRQIGSSLTMYADDYDGFIYPAVYNEGWKAPMGEYPPGSAWPFALGAYVREAGVFRCPNDDLFPPHMRFAWPEPSEPRDPERVRVSYIYVGLNIWSGPDKPWLTDQWPRYLRRLGSPDEGSDDTAYDKRWVIRDKDWWGPSGGWVTAHDQSATEDRPLDSGSNVLLLDGSARWHPYWDN